MEKPCGRNPEEVERIVHAKNNAVVPVVVKAGFNHRRKTLRNALKNFTLQSPEAAEYLSKRAEQLTVQDFVKLTKIIEKKGN